MRFSFLVFFSLFVMLVSMPSRACVPSYLITSSMVPVTVKIAGTYLQIPEAYLDISYLRVPKERQDIRIAMPVKALDPMLNVDEMIYIQIRDKNRVEDIGESLDGGALFYRVEPISRNEQYKDIALKYIQSISSVKEPKTWKSDVALVERFHLGVSPCDRTAPRPNLTAENISADEIAAGLHHRNEEVRKAVAAYVTQLHKEEAK